MTKQEAGELPAPLTPADCDLRDFAFMPLDVVRLRDSDLAVTAEADEFRCAVLLWCASWHQVPAASLPDDDKILAQFAGYGRVVKEWMKVRTGALRGWVKCADGRLYHPVVAEKANDAWTAKLRQRLNTECARIKKHNLRHPGANVPFPEFDAWLEAGCPVGQPLFIPEDKANMSLGHEAIVPRDIDPLSPGQGGTVPRENQSKGQGEGQGQGQLNSKPESSSQASTGVGAGQQRDDDDDRLQGSKRGTAIVMLLREHGISATSDHEIVRSWSANPRVTRELLTVAIEKVRKWKPQQDIPLRYLESTVNTILEDQAAPARAPAPQATPIATPPRPPQGNEPKGTDESYDDWRARTDAFERQQRNGGKAA